MELEVLRHSGIPPSSIVSIRAGGTRRQAQLSALDRPFKFPCKPEECTTFKVDVLDLLGTARLAYNPSEDEYSLALEPVSEGHAVANMEVAFTVHRVSEGGAHPGEAEAEGDRARDHRKETAARDYLEKHGLTAFMQFLMQSLMKDKPAEPYAFLQKEVTKRMVAEITKNAEDQGLETVLAKFAAQAPQDVTLEQLSVLESEAAAVGEQLRHDNARLRETTSQLLNRYGQLLEESSLLQRYATGKGADVSESLQPLEALVEGDGSGEQSQSLQLAAYRDIAKMQEDVNALAKENGVLVAELARMLSSIHTVRGDIDAMQQSLAPPP